MRRRRYRRQRKQPVHLWSRIWKNINGQHISSTIHATWFRAKHKIFPNNERLHGIRLSDTHKYVTCSQTDTTLRWMTSCLRAKDIWLWARFPNRPDAANRSESGSHHVDSVYLAMQTWSQPRHNAIIWLVSHMVHFCIQGQSTLEL
jgi:hypothetical protein